ncbi:MAG TPA: CoA-transferase [Candidatus Tectomicrobia bacterium]|nr:CoA-transferase [Candidatus Tectomicrobia bacterium]
MTLREFTAVEMMTCMAARLFEDNKAYFIGFGMPQIAAVLAQQLYAPHIIWVYEYGTIAPQFPLPFEPLILGDSKSNYRAVSWKDMNQVFAQAAQGFVDYGMLGALQIDPHGNINSSYVGGTYAQPGRRFASTARRCQRHRLAVLAHDLRHDAGETPFRTEARFHHLPRLP